MRSVSENDKLVNLNSEQIEVMDKENNNFRSSASPNVNSTFEDSEKPVSLKLYLP